MAESSRCAMHPYIESSTAENVANVQKIRDIAIENKTNIKNFQEWLPKIEKKVDNLLWKVVGGVIFVNAIMYYLPKPH